MSIALSDRTAAWSLCDSQAVARWKCAASACSHSERVHQRRIAMQTWSVFAESTRSLAAQWPHSRRLFIYMFISHNSTTRSSWALWALGHSTSQCRVAEPWVNSPTNELDHSSSSELDELPIEFLHTVKLWRVNFTEFKPERPSSAHIRCSAYGIRTSKPFICSRTTATSVPNFQLLNSLSLISQFFPLLHTVEPGMRASEHSSSIGHQSFANLANSPN